MLIKSAISELIHCMCEISQINGQRDIQLLLKHFGNTNMIVSLELTKQLSRQRGSGREWKLGGNSASASPASCPVRGISDQLS